MGLEESSFGYRVLAAWSGPLDAVTFRHADRRRAAWSDELAEQCRRLVRRYEREGRPLLTLDDGSLPPLYRLEEVVTASPTALVVATTTTDYADFLLSNVEHPEWRHERGDAAMADPIGVSALLRTADGEVIYGRRSGRTHDSPGAFHVLPSGHPHPPETITEAIENELVGEVGIALTDVIDASVTGVVRAAGTGKPEITMRLTTRLSTDELSGRRADAVERWEFAEVVALRWERETVTRWLRDHSRTCVAPGLAAVALAGRIDFGDAWFEALEVSEPR